MRVLFITSSSINGGAQKHIKEMFFGLSHLGNEVFLVAPKGWLLAEIQAQSNNYYALDSKITNTRCLIKIMDDIKPDVINTFILSGGCFGTLSWKRRKFGKLFITVNNPVIYNGISIQRKMIYPLLYRWMSKYATAFLVKSNAVSDELTKVIKNKKPVVSIKNGIDFSIFDVNKQFCNLRKQYGINSSEFVICNIAALKAIKGQRYLIEAVAQLREKYNVHLFLVGDGVDKPIIESQIQKIQACSYIHLLGRRSDVNCILSNSNCFVLSSINEGLPNALMEAMAMRLPCVATRVGGVDQLIDDEKNGLLVSSKSSREIYRAVEYILNNKEFARQISINAYNKIYNEYQQESVALDLLNSYMRY